MYKIDIGKIRTYVPYVFKVDVEMYIPYPFKIKCV